MTTKSSWLELTLWVVILFLVENTHSFEESLLDNYYLQRNPTSVKKVIKLSNERKETSVYFGYEEHLFEFRIEDYHLDVYLINGDGSELLDSIDVQEKLYRISGITFDNQQTIYLLLSGENFQIYAFNSLSQKLSFVTITRPAFGCVGFQFAADLSTFLICGIQYCYLVNMRGEATPIDFGMAVPDLSSSAANQTSFAINLNRGLSIYRPLEDSKRIYDFNKEYGFPNYLASIGNSWAMSMIKANLKTSCGMILNQEASGVYSRRIIKLDSDYHWKLQDYGALAVFYAKGKREVKVVSTDFDTDLVLPWLIGDWTLCEGRSNTTLFFRRKNEIALINISPP